jgi:hypothetical protein
LSIFLNGLSDIHISGTAIEIVNAKLVVEPNARSESLPNFGINYLRHDFGWSSVSALQNYYS